MSVATFPPNLGETDFRNLYDKEICRHTASLKNEICQLLARPDISPDVTDAEVQVFPEEYGDGHVSIWIYFAGRNNLVRKNDPTLYCGAAYQFLKEVEDIPLYDPGSYEFSVPDLTVRSLIDWFVECWNTAGGANFRLPVSIIGHDGYGTPDRIDLTHLLSKPK